MDQSPLVTDQIEDGRRFVERFAADGNPISAAFWLRETDEANWFLYVVTDLVDQQGPAAAYRAVHAALQKRDESLLSSSEIKVIGLNHPLAQEGLALQADLAPRLAHRTGMSLPGALQAGPAYLYSPRSFTPVPSASSTMSVDEIGQKLLRLMDPAVGRSPANARVTLTNGAYFDGLPLSITRGGEKGPIIQFITPDGQIVPREVRLDEISTIA